ncbi:MAG: haloacid dehalogenase type II, partial [Achromobacter piechaudii]
MPLTSLPRPEWLTFDCYGTLIQWDEGLHAAVTRFLANTPQEQATHHPTPTEFLRVYD